MGAEDTPSLGQLLEGYPRVFEAADTATQIVTRLTDRRDRVDPESPDNEELAMAKRVQAEKLARVSWMAVQIMNSGGDPDEALRAKESPVSPSPPMW